MQQGQQNDYGFIPDPHSDLPYAVYVDDRLAFCLVLIAGIVVALFVLRRRRSRR